jgi:hypothetical protein
MKIIAFKVLVNINEESGRPIILRASSKSQNERFFFFFFNISNDFYFYFCNILRMISIVQNAHTNAQQW